MIANLTDDQEPDDAPGEGDESDDIPPMRRVASKVLIAAGLIAIWTVLFPVLYGFCVGLLMILPPAAIAMVGFSRGQLRFVNQAGEITSYALTTALVTSCVLVYRSFDIHTLGWIGLVVVAGALGIGFAGAVAWIDWPNRHWRLLLTMMGIGLIWGWGCATFGNMLLDVRSKQIFHPMFSTYSEGGFTVSGSGRYVSGRLTRHVTLAPWGPIAERSDIIVSEELYQSARIGDPICVELGQGYFHTPWYSLSTCETH